MERGVLEFNSSVPVTVHRGRTKLQSVKRQYFFETFNN